MGFLSIELIDYSLKTYLPEFNLNSFYKLEGVEEDNVELPGNVNNRNFWEKQARLASSR